MVEKRKRKMGKRRYYRRGIGVGKLGRRVRERKRRRAGFRKEKIKVWGNREEEEKEGKSRTEGKE